MGYVEMHDIDEMLNTLREVVEKYRRDETLG